MRGDTVGDAVGVADCDALAVVVGDKDVLSDADGVSEPLVVADSDATTVCEGDGVTLGVLEGVADCDAVGDGDDVAEAVVLAVGVDEAVSDGNSSDGVTVAECVPAVGLVPIPVLVPVLAGEALVVARGVDAAVGDADAVDVAVADADGADDGDELVLTDADGEPVGVCDRARFAMRNERITRVKAWWVRTARWMGMYMYVPQELRGMRTTKSQGRAETSAPSPLRPSPARRVHAHAL